MCRVSGNDASVGWVTVSRSGTTASQRVWGLSPGTAYRVRVRATNAAGNSAWVFGDGTPQGASSDADLSALTAADSTSSTGTFTALELTPSTFSATTTSYTAGTVANARAYVKLTATVADTGKATVTMGTGSTLGPVTSGSASDAIALNTGANTVTVRVTAEDGRTTKDYTVSVYRQAGTGALDAPGSITYTAVDSAVYVAWTAVEDAATYVIQRCPPAEWDATNQRCNRELYTHVRRLGATSTVVAGLTNGIGIAACWWAARAIARRRLDGLETGVRPRRSRGLGTRPRGAVVAIPAVAHRAVIATRTVPDLAHVRRAPPRAHRQRRRRDRHRGLRCRRPERGATHARPTTR